MPTKKEEQLLEKNKANNTEPEILFSEQAYKDGYDFSCMSKEEQILSRTLYYSFDHMSRLYDILSLYNEISKSPDDSLYILDEGWLFPESGVYFGCVLGSEKSKKGGSNEYILRLIIDENTVRYLKFSRSFSDPIMEAIQEKWKHKPNPLNPFKLSCIKGKILSVKIENIITNRGRPFSKIMQAKFLDETSENCIIKMINLMIDQSQES